MIYFDSRYADGIHFKAYDSRTGKIQQTVFKHGPNTINLFSFTTGLKATV
jgi:hypothetical protein